VGKSQKKKDRWGGGGGQNRLRRPKLDNQQFLQTLDERLPPPKKNRAIEQLVKSKTTHTQGKAGGSGISTEPGEERVDQKGGRKRHGEKLPPREAVLATNRVHQLLERRKKRFLHRGSGKNPVEGHPEKRKGRTIQKTPVPRQEKRGKKRFVKTPKDQGSKRKKDPSKTKGPKKSWKRDSLEARKRWVQPSLSAAASTKRPWKKGERTKKTCCKLRRKQGDEPQAKERKKKKLSRVQAPSKSPNQKRLKKTKRKNP